MYKQFRGEKIIIFGTQDLAQLAEYYLKHDSPHQVVGFCVNDEYKTSDALRGLPVWSFEDIQDNCSPRDYKFLCPMTGSKMNINRKEVYRGIKQKGYEFISYISSKATLTNASIGENCFILEDNTLQPFVEIGDNVVLWSGNHIGHHSTIANHVFFASHVVLSGHCQVESHSWFGVNSTIRDGLKIAEGSLVAMGACLTKNTEEWSVYMGVPAKKLEGRSSLEANP